MESLIQALPQELLTKIMWYALESSHTDLECGILKHAMGTAIYNKLANEGGIEATPKDFICSITCDIMNNPVITVDGNSYEREAIEGWFSTGKVTSPLTGATLNSTNLTPNQALRRLIIQYNEEYIIPLAASLATQSAPPAPSASLAPYTLPAPSSLIKTIKIHNGTYTGEVIYKNGRYIRHGRGLSKRTNCEKYYGEYKDGKKHGHGNHTYKCSSESERKRKSSTYYIANYTGEFKDNKKHGHGHVSGDYMKVNGIICHGKYEGDWQNDKYHGRGVFNSWYVAQSGMHKYDGEWQNGKPNGRGVYTWNLSRDGRNNCIRYNWGFSKDGHTNCISYNNKCHNKYDGEFKDGNVHGRGVYTWDNRCNYKYNRNGRNKYDGEFKDGCQQGRGVITRENRQSIHDKWMNGKPYTHQRKIYRKIVKHFE